MLCYLPHRNTLTSHRRNAGREVLWNSEVTVPNEIHFVDGAEHSLLDWHKDALTSAAAHFLDCFRIEHEVNVYVSRRSVLHAMSSNSRAWHMPPTFDRNNSLVCAYIDPDLEIEDNDDRGNYQCVEGD